MITIGQLRSRLQELGPEYDHTDVIVEVYDEEMNLHLAGLRGVALEHRCADEESLFLHGDCAEDSSEGG